MINLSFSNSRASFVNPRYNVASLARFRNIAVKFSSSAPESPYLHETKIPTYHFQDSLPKLPVPKLEDTLQKYIYFSEPMVSPEEWEITKTVSKEFENGDGAVLQKELVELDKQVSFGSILHLYFHV